MTTQVSKQNSGNNFMIKLTRFLENDISVAKICKVVNYNKKKHIADVLPLANSSDGQVSAQLLELPVAKSCYQVDELVEKLKPDFKAIDSFKTEKGGKIGSNLVSSLPKKVMKKGAIVIVVMLDNDNDNWRGTSSFTPETDRKHDINDGIIVGVLK